MSQTEKPPSYPPISVTHFIARMLGAGLSNLQPHRRDQLNRLVIRLRNGSPGALHDAWRFDRGEIGGEQLLDLMGTSPPLEVMLPEAVNKVVEFPAPHGHRYVPDSVLVFARSLADKFAELPADRQARLRLLLVGLRDGAESAWSAADSYDRGEISGDGLLDSIDESVR